MQAVIGLALMAFSIFFGLFAGVWICFIGGIVDIIEQIKGPELSALVIAFGIFKVFFSGIIGWVSGIFMFGTGFTLLITSGSK